MLHAGTGPGSHTLIVTEHEYDRVEALEREPELLAKADAAAFTFDSTSPASFRQAQEMLLRMAHASGHTLPCVLVAVDEHGGMTPVSLECSAFESNSHSLTEFPCTHL